ncbi:MAG TPA: malonyl CoA-ACP transacylase [Mycobacterium sp.]|nr:malonyl CoA-ACP transacylase [Mycobacterium sp.]
MSIAARVAGQPVLVKEIDEREAQLRGANLASALPRPGTSEGRQLRRWLTQLVVAERVVAVEARRRGLTAEGAPAVEEILGDNAARLEIGSVAASTLAAPLARAVFAAITADVAVGDAEIADYHARNPLRFTESPVASERGWRSKPQARPLPQVRDRIYLHLLGSARRRAFRRWLDARCAAVVELAPGYEHPGDPRQPDNTHRH